MDHTDISAVKRLASQLHAGADQLDPLQLVVVEQAQLFRALEVGACEPPDEGGFLDEGDVAALPLRLLEQVVRLLEIPGLVELGRRR